MVFRQLDKSPQRPRKSAGDKADDDKKGEEREGERKRVGHFGNANGLAFFLFLGCRTRLGISLGLNEAT